MRGIFSETLVEFFDRKQHLLFFLITSAAMGLIYLAVSQKMKLVENDITTQALLVQSAVSSFSIFMSVIVMLAAASTIFLIPRIAQKGRVEFYLSKPITRSTLFYSKVASICFIYSCSIVFCGAVVSAELIFLKVIGLVDASYIVAIGFVVFFIWFSVTSFIGFLTRSVTTCFSVFAALWVAQLLLKNRASWSGENAIVNYLVDAVYYILPKTSEMSSISVQLASGGNPTDFLPIFTSLLVAAALVYLAAKRFARLDF